MLYLERKGYNITKRSEVNAAIEWEKKLLEDNNISLPQFSEWKHEDWLENEDRMDMIRQTMLGWDVKHYGLNNFQRIGGVLFTVRNVD